MFYNTGGTNTDTLKGQQNNIICNWKNPRQHNFLPLSNFANELLSHVGMTMHLVYISNTIWVCPLIVDTYFYDPPCI